MSRFCFCNCPAGFSAEPERHAPDCPGRSGAGKARTPVPATLTASQPADSGVDFGIDGRSVRVSQEAYSIFLAREAAGREKIAALQQRLTAADEREDRLASLTNDDLIAIARAAALNSVHRYNYMPCLPEDAYKWEPHYWVIEAMRVALKPADGSKPSTCTWSEGGFSWHTGCGKEWQFTDGDLPSENGMHFCHSCGKTLVVEEAGAETEKDNDWRMNPCKQGHRDVGAAGGVAACNECDEKIEAPTTQEAFERWNATHPKL